MANQVGGFAGQAEVPAAFRPVQETLQKVQRFYRQPLTKEMVDSGEWKDLRRELLGVSKLVNGTVIAKMNERELLGAGNIAHKLSQTIEKLNADLQKIEEQEVNTTHWLWQKLFGSSGMEKFDSIKEEKILRAITQRRNELLFRELEREGAEKEAPMNFDEAVGAIENRFDKVQDVLKAQGFLGAWGCIKDPASQRAVLFLYGSDGRLQKLNLQVMPQGILVEGGVKKNGRNFDRFDSLQDIVRATIGENVTSLYKAEERQKKMEEDKRIKELEKRKPEILQQLKEEIKRSGAYVKHMSPEGCQEALNTFSKMMEQNALGAFGFCMTDKGELYLAYKDARHPKLRAEVVSIDQMPADDIARFAQALQSKSAERITPFLAKFGINPERNFFQMKHLLSQCEAAKKKLSQFADLSFYDGRKDDAYLKLQEKARWMHKSAQGAFSFYTDKQFPNEVVALLFDGDRIRPITFHIGKSPGKFVVQGKEVEFHDLPKVFDSLGMKAPEHMLDPMVKRVKLELKKLHSESAFRKTVEERTLLKDFENLADELHVVQREEDAEGAWCICETITPAHAPSAIEEFATTSLGNTGGSLIRGAGDFLNRIASAIIGEEEIPATQFTVVINKKEPSGTYSLKKWTLALDPVSGKYSLSYPPEDALDGRQKEEFSDFEEVIIRIQQKTQRRSLFEIQNAAKSLVRHKREK